LTTPATKNTTPTVTNIDVAIAASSRRRSAASIADGRTYAPSIAKDQSMAGTRSASRYRIDPCDLRLFQAIRESGSITAGARVSTSVAPPGAKPTTMRIGRLARLGEQRPAEQHRSGCGERLQQKTAHSDHFFGSMSTAPLDVGPTLRR
jgi:hypothetical protein